MPDPHDSEAVRAADHSMRMPEFRPHRSRWPGVLAAAGIGAVIAAAAVSNWVGHTGAGARQDAALEAARAPAADAGITAAVKAALASDPALQASSIEVSTHDGVVTLAGPAPDPQARERAAVLAAAPQGVRSVDNRLVVSAASGGSS
jgi:osmotically-inducible protein OsmY